MKPIRPLRGFQWPKWADGSVKSPSELTDDERRALERHVDAQIAHELATADYGSDDTSDE
jgi:hypothetical protein